MLVWPRHCCYEPRNASIPSIKVVAMKTRFLFSAIGLGSALLFGLPGCAPAQPDVANPVVKGDKSTIANDAKATDLQQTESEQ
jgi:hypothetical protein